MAIGAGDLSSFSSFARVDGRNLDGVEIWITPASSVVVRSKATTDPATCVGLGRRTTIAVACEQWDFERKPAERGAGYPDGLGDYGPVPSETTFHPIRGRRASVTKLAGDWVTG